MVEGTIGQPAVALRENERGMQIGTDLVTNLFCVANQLCDQLTTSASDLTTILMVSSTVNLTYCRLRE